MRRRVLIVEDDRSLAKILRAKLTIEGFDVAWAENGETAQTQARTLAPDVILLDVSLPGVSGFELCRTWRDRKRTAILMLTARSEKRDRLRGLRLGADDHITNPFDMEELLARIQVVLRRLRPDIERLTLGRVTIDFHTYRAHAGDGSAIELTQREFEILRYLAERPDIIVSRDELLHAIWEYTAAGHTRAVDQAILRLRRKIEPDAGHARFIHTVHGNGYRLTPEGSDG